MHRERRAGERLPACPKESRVSRSRCSRAGARGRELEVRGPGGGELELEGRAAGIKKPPALGRGSLAVLRGLKAKVCLDLDRGVR